MKIFIRDGGTMRHPDLMKPVKWTNDPLVREFDSVAEITNTFDREHVAWMIENDQLSSRLGERFYEIFEDEK